MNINYLSALYRVEPYQEKNYTILEDKGDGFSSVIKDTIHFNSADRNGDDFLTYSELADIDLALAFNAKDDKYELTKGINFISKDAVDGIFKNSGISLEDLQNELKNLDKNNDKKITSDEIVSLDTKKLEKDNTIAYNQYKLQKVEEVSSEKVQSTEEDKRIAELDKQINNLKSMLNSLSSQKNQEPIKIDTQDATDFNLKSVQNILKTDDLKTKYGSKDVDNVVQTIKHIPKVEGNVDSIILKTGTKMSEDEILELSDNIDLVMDSELAISNMEDMAGIEQFSPANTPLFLDKENIDFSIDQIKLKINDLEDMKSKILTQKMDRATKKLDITV